MNERLVVWNDRTIEIIKITAQRLTRMIPALIAHQITLKTADLIITTNQIAGVATEDLVAAVIIIAVTVGVIEVSVIAANVIVANVKSARLLLDQMMYCYQ
jgi:hypothetical protein